jgi:hypothetical protein
MFIHGLKPTESDGDGEKAVEDNSAVCGNLSKYTTKCKHKLG